MHFTNHYRPHYVFSVCHQSLLGSTSNGGRSLSSGSPNCPPPQPRGYHGDSSKRRNPRGYLTHKNNAKVMLRPTVSRTACLGVKKKGFYFCESCGFVDVWYPLRQRTGLPFTITAGLRQRSHSRIRASLDSWPYFTSQMGGSIISFAMSSLSVVQYDSQCYGGCIRTHLHAEIAATANWPCL
jgi:hypothetical protein